jgi:hypothetical protein
MTPETVELFKKLQEVQPKTLLLVQTINKEIICTSYISEIESKVILTNRYSEEICKEHTEEQIINSFLKDSIYISLTNL